VHYGWTSDDDAHLFPHDIPRCIAQQFSLLSDLPNGAFMFFFMQMTKGEGMQFNTCCLLMQPIQLGLSLVT